MSVFEQIPHPEEFEVPEPLWFESDDIAVPADTVVVVVPSDEMDPVIRFELSNIVMGVKIDEQRLKPHPGSGVIELVRRLIKSTEVL